MFYLGHLVIINISIRIYHCHFYLGGGYDGLHWNWDDGSEWRYNDSSKVWANGEPENDKGSFLMGTRYGRMTIVPYDESTLNGIATVCQNGNYSTMTILPYITRGVHLLFQLFGRITCVTYRKVRQ